MLVGIGLSLS